MDSSQNKAVVAVVVIALLAVAATVAIVMTNNNAGTDSAMTATDAPLRTSGTQSDIPANATFEDGTYTATGSYQTPGGIESIGVKVSLSGGVITDAQVTKQGKTGEAQEYQGEFVSNFKPQVVGKKITEVKLDRVAGSSLTSGGFNDAINNIAIQAKI